MGLSRSVDETLDTRQKAKAEAVVEDRALARLRLVYPAGHTGTIDLGKSRVILGRHPEQLGAPAILHPSVSRAHFEVEWDESLGEHVGRDLGSRNGSWLDGERIDEAWAPLREGAVLRIGDVILVMERGNTLRDPDAPQVSRENVPGGAMVVRRLRGRLARAAPDLSPVLIIGETGTGKEKIAEEVHRLSGRSGPFLAVNCATLGEQLIESQLFGHLKGSFTGAVNDHPGLFRAAEGGTLFLDEIGEMPKDLQPKLLRAIQEKEVRAVGATKSVKVDVRIVAATHQDLVQKARTGEFRQDLYARLALWELRLPALRERRADVLVWLSRMGQLWRHERGHSDERELPLDPEAAEALLLAVWPENLRGIHRLVHELFSQRLTTVTRADLPRWVFASEGG